MASVNENMVKILIFGVFNCLLSVPNNNILIKSIPSLLSYREFDSNDFVVLTDKSPIPVGGKLVGSSLYGQVLSSIPCRYLDLQFAEIGIIYQSNIIN